MAHPIALIRQYETDFARQLPHIRDGDPEAVHQGRVATRRLREGLRLLDDAAGVDEALSTARTVGRALGHVRELDVLADLLRRFELNIPVTAAAAATAAAALRVEQRRARRQMIKSLDRIDLRAIETTSLKVSRTRSPFRHGDWAEHLLERIGSLASELEEVLRRASGIYLPNRSHRLRVVVKKLRYAVEAADATHVWRMPGVLSALRRSQSRLGELHDLHIAHTFVNPDRVAESVRNHTSILRDIIAAEIDRRQRQFVASRNDLAAAAAACRRARALRRRHAWRARGTMLIAAAAVPGVAALLASAITSGRDLQAPVSH